MFQLRHTNPNTTYAYQTVIDGPIDFELANPFRDTTRVFRFGTAEDLAVQPAPQPKANNDMGWAFAVGAAIGLALAL